MQEIEQKLIIGDYYQYFNYPIRKQIIALIKQQKFHVITQIIGGLIPNDKVLPQLDESIQIVSIFNPQYPQLLLETYDPPLVLYCKGNVALLQQSYKIAIVGSRNPQQHSLAAAQRIIKDLKVKNEQAIDPVIVSGLALGIDGYSHTLALKHHLPTIAVLGFGFEYMYPVENKQLLTEIIEHGLVISEYPPHTSVSRWQFVARNRIIAGLCPSVVVVEAKAKSGSLITAELALAENREVFIVSGTSFDETYLGSHKLVQEGAKLLLNVEEILADYKY